MIERVTGLATDPQIIRAEIATMREERSFRPTVVLLAHTTGQETEFLYGQSAKHPGALFWPLQGGVEEHETPELAVTRELEEEIPGTLVCPDRVTLLGAMRYTIPRSSRDGYEKGKFLIACEVPLPIMSIDELGEPAPSEVACVKGVGEAEVASLLLENTLSAPRVWRKSLLIHRLTKQIAAERKHRFNLKS